MSRETKMMIALTVAIIASTINCVVTSYSVRSLRNDLLNASIVCEHIEEN